MRLAGLNHRDSGRTRLCDSVRIPVFAREVARIAGCDVKDGAKLNYAEQVFRNRRTDSPAVVHKSEIRGFGEMSWRDLEEKTAALTAGLKSLGVGRGDRVVAYLPNVPEALVGMLACASLGAIRSSCGPDFGTGSVVDRFRQIEPKVLLAVDGYRYGGKNHDRTQVVARLQAEIPSLKKTVVLPYLNEACDTEALSDVVLWNELLSAHGGAELTFEQVPFDHPLWILYSSGTTGLPKAIVQSQGGILIEHLKSLSLQMDLKPGDRFFLVHYYRLDDVEHGRGESLIWCHRPSLRREPRTPRHERPLALRRGDRHVPIRHERDLPDFLYESRRRTGQRLRPELSKDHRLDRLALAARGLRVGIRACMALLR